MMTVFLESSLQVTSFSGDLYSYMDMMDGFSRQEADDVTGYPRPLYTALPGSYQQSIKNANIAE
jgi:hypothetical protein